MPNNNLSFGMGFLGHFRQFFARVRCFEWSVSFFVYVCIFDGFFLQQQKNHFSHKSSNLEYFAHTKMFVNNCHMTLERYQTKEEYTQYMNVGEGKYILYMRACCAFFSFFFWVERNEKMDWQQTNDRKRFSKNFFFESSKTKCMCVCMGSFCLFVVLYRICKQNC